MSNPQTAMILKNAFMKYLTGKNAGGAHRVSGAYFFCQQSSAPAGMPSSSMTSLRSSPDTAEMIIPQLSCPIIFLGGRLVQARTVFPTSS